MTQDLLTDLGEEYLVKNGLDAITVTVGLYNDATDGLSDTSDVGDITTEPDPGTTNYAQASVTLSAADLSGNWGVENDTLFDYDFSDVDTSEELDTAFITYSFTAEDTGDGSSTEHLLANPALSQTRDIGSIDTLEVAAGDLTVTVD